MRRTCSLPALGVDPRDLRVDQLVEAGGIDDLRHHQRLAGLAVVVDGERHRDLFAQVRAELAQLLEGLLDVRLGVAVAVGAAREVLRPPLGERRVLGDALFDQGPHLRQLFGHVRQAHPDGGARRSAIEQSGRGAAAGGECGVDLAAERGQRRDALAIRGGVAAPGDLGGERHAPELRGGRQLIARRAARRARRHGRRAPRRRAPRRASRARRG